MAQPIRSIKNFFRKAVGGALVVGTLWLGTRDETPPAPEVKPPYPAAEACINWGGVLGGPIHIDVSESLLKINTKHSSPNYEPRFTSVKYIVLHYTATESCDIALNTLTNSKGKNRVSAHYLVDEEGHIMRLIDEDFVAWHAGKSYWDGDPRINDYSIGIEIQNRSQESFPIAQMQAVIKLCQDIMQRHNIPGWNVIGHSDIAPDRKQDPGEYFPWRALGEYGIGIWPDEIVTPPKNTDRMKLFQELGYGTKGQSEKNLIKAFQRHFDPKAYADSSQIGVMTPSTLAKLYSACLEKRGMENPLSIYNKQLVKNLHLKIKPPIL